MDNNANSTSSYLRSTAHNQRSTTRDGFSRDAAYFDSYTVANQEFHLVPHYAPGQSVARMQSAFEAPSNARPAVARVPGDPLFARDLYGVLDFLGDDQDQAVQPKQSIQYHQRQLEADERQLMIQQQNQQRYLSSGLESSAFFEMPHAKPARLQIPTDDVFFAPPRPTMASSRNSSLDYGVAPLTPSSSPYSAASSRNNSIDMESSSFNANMFQHQQYKRQMDANRPNEPLRYNHGSLYNTPPSPRESAFSVAPSPLQATGGGTAAITPELAEALTVAQVQLSQRKKQRDTFPPLGYTCRLCSIEGHWMENCILYKSNKHPQYNNAARAVALNIISETSQHVLEALPVVQQPKQKFTPKFYQEYQQQQAQLQLEQQQQQHRLQMQRLQEQHYLNEMRHQQQIQAQQHFFHSTEYRSFSPPSPANSASSGSRFEGLWASEN